jgi:hypothetical protein
MISINSESNFSIFLFIIFIRSPVFDPINIVYLLFSDRYPLSNINYFSQKKERYRNSHSFFFFLPPLNNSNVQKSGIRREVTAKN